MSKYIDKLTKKDIAHYLNSIGYSFNEKLFDDMGRKISAYEKIITDKTKECGIIAKCIKTNKNPILNELSNTLSLRLSTHNSYFNNLESAILVFEDFEVNTLTLDLETDFQNTFAKFMYAKFGEEYKKDYNDFVKNELKKQNELDSPIEKC